MKVFKWSKEYSVDIVEIDAHHSRLFDILNELLTLMSEGGASDRQILKVLEELLDYTHYHFDEEEKIMAQMGYPDLEAHQKIHRQFIQQIKDFYTSAQNGMAIFVATKVANIGIDWLKSHILTVDHQYSEYMKQQGLQF